MSSAAIQIASGFHQRLTQLLPRAGTVPCGWWRCRAHSPKALVPRSLVTAGYWKAQRSLNLADVSSEHPG